VTPLLTPDAGVFLHDWEHLATKRAKPD
jgi:hypothetical protein